MREEETVRYFNVAEANALIPLLTRALTELQQLRTAARGYHREMELCKAVGRGPDGHLIMAADYQAAQAGLEASVARMREILIQVQHHGCQIKHIEAGLVDFPARLDGHAQPVLLCWKLGEPFISHYHGMMDGFAARRPLPRLNQARRTSM